MSQKTSKKGRKPEKKATKGDILELIKSKVTPVTGYLIIKSEVKPGFTPPEGENRANILPPSDFFVIDPGKTVYKKGQRLVLKGTAMLLPLFDEDDRVYVVNEMEIVAFYE